MLERRGGRAAKRERLSNMAGENEVTRRQDNGFDALLQDKRRSQHEERHAREQEAQRTGIAVPMARVVRQNLVGHRRGIHAQHEQPNPSHPSHAHDSDYTSTFVIMSRNRIG